ncbi:hypothetical protein Hena1_00090 [Erwinia phage Hena1]|uniref:Uncharacterized protein n=1 Tax=Erwinia phage Hena1 TaxID=2678601 RepID=A0A6B9J5P8_9CAUD|nr:hypothetical protein HWC84_gp008 [Erwinia phage Hena1]QGZ16185.1 hypothetical protein Hena1_00090 [Erwinia phage Hena1]
MACFKHIKKGQFFQDTKYRVFNSKHCYLKTGTYHYLDLEKNITVDVRKSCNDFDVSNEESFRFFVVKVEIKVTR